jgi:ribosome-binding factor A
MTRREEKIISILKKLFSDFFLKVDLDKNIITPTRVRLSKDLKSAKIFISVFPEGKESAALAVLKKHIKEFREYVGQKIKIRQLPWFEFEIDKGEKNRQRIEEILGTVAPTRRSEPQPR